ncbi:MAG: F0F1 ATP synthase subunit A [Planctomycetota bacterium]
MNAILESALIIAAADPVDHVVNHKFWTVNGYWIWSGHLGNLLLAAIIVVAGGLWFAKQVETGPESQGNDRFLTKNRFAHMIEALAVYLRDEMVQPLLHERTERFMPFLWTLFFFILVNNLLGLVPILDMIHLISPDLKKAHAAPFGGTPTQNLAITAALALFSVVVFNIAGIKELGIKGYLEHQTGGLPLGNPLLWPVVALVFIIEVAGNLLIKPIALAIRLFANMTAGHILVATLFGFVGAGVELGGLAGTTVSAVSFVGAIAIYFLEIFVAFLQAFVFMFLTTVFISLLSHHGDEHEHHDSSVAHA